jgi:hypothetical protein
MKWFHYIFVCSSLALVAGCAEKKPVAGTNVIAGNRYDSEFPSGNVSAELEKVTRFVKKLYSISSYTTYQFRRESRITGYHLQKGSYRNAAWGVISTNETVFGTAIIVGVSGTKIALLTCAHVVNSPDTLISYFEPEGEDPISYIRSFAVKEKQENWVKDLTDCGSFTVLVSDNTNDIAILGKNCEVLTDTIAPFQYPAGHAKDLGWGSFVYVFGYPMGSQMVTTGLVSPAAKRPMGEFTIDALLNKGCSGGVILAIRGGMPNFELVGMVKTVISNREDFLKPAPDNKQTVNWLPYKGDAYVGTGETIQYGLNAVVPFESILEFYKKNRPDLISGGYNLDNFFHP